MRSILSHVTLYFDSLILLVAMNVNKYFPFLLIFSVVAAAMEIELSLPSFPDIARAFSVSEDMIEGTISLNFLGFCISALFYGPLADRFGRRTTLLSGVILFLLGSFGCSFASTIDMLLISRFIQGLGAAGSFVVVFIMMSDVYKENEATRWIGTLNAILTATMALSPILGGYLNLYFGWNSCYTFIAGMTAIQLLLLFFFLPETRKGTKVDMKETLGDYLHLFTSLRFTLSSLIPTFISGGYFAFISVIPFLYRDELQMSLREFSWHQAAIISSFSLASYYSNKIADCFGSVRSALIGSCTAATSTFIVLVLSLIEPIPSVLWITPLMCIAAASCAVPFAIVFGASLSLVPGKNGPASSLLMSVRTLVCAVMIQLVAILYNGTLLSSVSVVAACYFISFLLTTWFYQGEIRAWKKNNYELE